MANQPNLAVSVDLLTVLFSDSDPNVRRASLEVYLRRVYRASCIKTLDISEKVGDALTAVWTFTARETVDGVGPVRTGFMAMLPSFDDMDKSLPSLMTAAKAALPAGS